ncbi:SSS family solute:Na+ symporter [Scopulibacillus darangshiensis]|uniref:SSS family solute:Na+ symporter n=1 Tax=Scopulibacillus darangshiensis TaxID=442528 RepID=A0A4R2NPK9_9BACL|nr:sodium:solute symporter [Scopulibacillus darangshiensis]TCP23753.1 SSS family solute:Na+ symporter [Scopulibacillus darangshiensis]
MIVSLLIIGLFLLLTLWLGISARKGKDMDLEQWAVGGRGFGTIFVFVLLAGETYTTFTFLGGSGAAYGTGGPALFILVYGSLANIIGYWVLPRIWKYAKEKQLVSQPDYFVSKYNSKGLGLLVTVVSVAALIPYLVMQFKGLGIIVSEASYGAISPTVSVWVSMVTLVIYVMISGIHSSARTAVIKDIMILGIVLFLGIYLPIHYYGGFQDMFQGIESAKPGFLMLDSEGNSPSWFISTVVLLSLGFYMYPHTFSSLYSSKSAHALRKNVSIMPLYALVIVFVFFVGFAAILQVPGLKGENVDLALFRLSLQTFDPWVIGLIGAAGLLTALVPGSMMLMATSTLIAKNIYKVFAHSADDQKVSKVARSLVPFVGLAAVWFTLYGTSTIASLIIVGSSLITQLTPSVLLALPKRPILTAQGSFSGIVTGVIIVSYLTLTGTTIGSLFPSLPQVVKDINIGLIALIINVIVSLSVSFIQKAAMAKTKTKKTYGVS